MNKLNCYASAAFGLEGPVASELRALHMSEVAAENGGVRFQASAEELYKCNLCLRECDRLYIIAAEGICTAFEDLYQLVYRISWQEYAEGREAINVSAKCARSTLMSPRDCQSVTKKAILSKLQSVRGQSFFPENGPPLPVQISVHNDRVKVLINTSGEALSRRGYRTWNGEAPLRETLAAALILLSPWNKSKPLYDPCCGTGTILTEAALIAANRAPGLKRNFSMEQFFCFRDLPFEKIRESVSSQIREDGEFRISGSDISPDAVELAERHIKQADFKGRIQVFCKPLQDVVLTEQGGVFICNPPYGERLSDRKSCRKLYGDLHLLKNRHPGWSMCVISSDPSFERAYGRKADKKRRFYNGRLECTYYIYY